MAIITATTAAENLSGTSEDDQFVFGVGTSLSGAPDTILNWQPGDTIDLSALGLTSADLQVRVLSGGAIIKLIQGFGATDFQLKIQTNGIDANTILASIVYDDVPPTENVPPTPQNDTLSVDVDTAGTVNVLANDSDPNGDALTVVSNTSAANGTVVDLGNGQFQYTPNAGFAGADSFTYTVQDPLGETATASVQVTITDPSGVNIITATPSTELLIGTPQADRFVFAPGTSTTSAIDTVAGWQPGDTVDLTGLGLTAADVQVRQLSGGAILKLVQGFGANDFQLKIQTNGFSSADVLASILYDGGTPIGNLPPSAVNDVLSVAQNTSGTVNVLANDSDPDGDALTIASFTQALNGTVEDLGNGQFSYAPNPLFTGTDSFSYTIQDPEGLTSTASVSVSVAGTGGLNVINATAARETLNGTTQQDLFVFAPGTSVTGAIDNLFNWQPGDGIDVSALGLTAADLQVRTLDGGGTIKLVEGFGAGQFQLRIATNGYDINTILSSIIFDGVQPPLTYGSLTLDGDLSDWAETDRLDDAASGTAGHAFYGAHKGGAFVFALQTDGAAIGANTTIWLNSDLNTSTGFQVFGNAVGAEYNINFNADGTASLYTGDAGQTLVSANLDVRYSADGTIAEIAVASNLLNGTPTSANVYADINNTVFIPGTYADASFIVSAATVPVAYGDLTLDGNLSDWASTDRLDDAASGVPGHAFYGAYEGNAFVFALQTDGAAIGANTTVWLNTDLNTSTGHQVFGAGVGAEYNINFDANGTVSLYSGNAGQTLVASGLDVRYSADGTIAEFAVTAAQMNGASVANVYADINDAVFIPNSFANSSFVVRDDVPPPVQDAKKIAIVYSETTSANSFSDTAYSQLFMAAQGQAMMSGVPYDIITEADLTDPALLGQYASIVFPSFSHVPTALVTPITNALLSAVLNDGVGLIAGGDFMTNDETGAALSGNAYQRMVDLFGVTAEGFGTTDGLDLIATNNTHSVSDEYTNNELVDSYGVPSFSHYTDVSGTGEVLFSQVVNGGAETHDAVIATTTTGRNVHFASDAIIGNSNILQDAIHWSVNGDAPSVTLQLTRGNGLFASRNDMDQSQETFDVSETEPGIYDVLIPMLEDWYTQYDFVGSYYVNVGNNPPDQATDWSVSRPYYEAIMALESEIGNHSYTHPHDTNELTPAEIEFEFGQATAVIAAQLGIPILGTAVPGAPEILPTTLQLLQYVETYLSGGYSSEGAGFPNAFGYIVPTEQDAIYLAPNMSFDFTLIEFQGRTPEEAELIWAEEYADLASHSDMPIFLFPWHDYGPTNWNTDPENGQAPGYTREMFESVIARAYADGMEFVTLLDLAERMAAFEAASLDVQTTANGFLVNVNASGAGHFALSVDEGQIIQNVGNWYAFSETDVFLPATGGQFAITTGAASDDITHIVSLPMRADLISVNGNGTGLNFTVTGSGTVGVELATWGSNSVIATNVDGAALIGDLFNLELANTQSHSVTMSYVASTTVNGTASNDAIVVGAGNQAVSGGQGNDTIISATGADTFIFGAGDGQDTLTESDASSSIDTLQLEALAPTDVTLAQVGNDLIVTLTATGDSFRVVDQFETATNGVGIEAMSFANGTVWDRATIASNTPPAANAEEQNAEKVAAVMADFGQPSELPSATDLNGGAYDIELGLIDALIPEHPYILEAHRSDDGEFEFIHDADLSFDFDDWHVA